MHCANYSLCYENNQDNDYIADIMWLLSSLRYKFLMESVWGGLVDLIQIYHVKESSD